MNLQENIHRIKEVMGIETTPINESIFSDIIGKVKDFFRPEIDLDNKRQQKHAVEAFQKLVDLIFKISIKESPVQGLERFVVIGVQKQNWGVNFNNPKDKGSQLAFTVNIQPQFNDSRPNPKEEHSEEFNNFADLFQNNAYRMGLTYSSPIQDKDISDHRVQYKIESKYPRYWS